MGYSEEVKKLAETLKNSGLVASMADALERAQSMVGRKKEEKAEEEPEIEIDVTQTTLSDVKEPEEKIIIDESPEIDGELKKEEVFTAKPEQKANEAEEEPAAKKISAPKKKIDLADIFNVNK